MENIPPAKQNDPSPISHRVFAPLVSDQKAKTETRVVSQFSESDAVQDQLAVGQRPESNARGETQPNPGLVPAVASLSPKVRSTTAAPFEPRTNGNPRPSPRRAETNHQKPDEIQIHIGRIEVIAAPPPTARPPAPSSRRGSQSLDEYLRRRDRRAV
jgi:hypothetical protein